MPLSPTYLWLIAGVVFIAMEALGLPGIGMLFVGLGAITTGMAINFGYMAWDAHLSQFILFFAATAIWTLVLWKPLQKIRMGQSRGGYNNIIGETAYVGSGGLSRDKGGEATWSGTIMKAELAETAPDGRLEAGTPVIIVEVAGAKLIVKPK